MGKEIEFRITGQNRNRNITAHIDQTKTLDLHSKLSIFLLIQKAIKLYCSKYSTFTFKLVNTDLMMISDKEPSSKRLKAKWKEASTQRRKLVNFISSLPHISVTFSVGAESAIKPHEPAYTTNSTNNNMLTAKDKFNIRQAKFYGKDIEVIDRNFILKRDKKKCYLCLSSIGIKNFHVDHLLPIGIGPSGPTYLAASCPACNSSKGRKMPNELSNVHRSRLEKKWYELNGESWQTTLSSYKKNYLRLSDRNA